MSNSGFFRRRAAGALLLAARTLSAALASESLASASLVGASLVSAALVSAVLVSAVPVNAQGAPTGAGGAGTVLDAAVPPGNNFDKAEFRLWYPNGVTHLRGIVLLMPGSNGDGRPMAQDTVWQAFAAKHQFALVAGRLTDKPHEQNFIEDYIKVAEGSGNALLSAIDELAAKSKHPELSTAPMLLWGMSAGGQFNYEFVAWKPERVIAFVVNKGGIYYSALLPRAARETPGVLFVGGKDLEFRTNTIVGLFAVNRRAGALWALSEEPSAAHIVGRSRDLALLFYEDVMAARLTSATGPLKPMPAKPAYLGDFKSRSFRPVGDGAAPGFPTAWLPSERVAQMWQAILTETAR